jgi:hypothetical protein
VATCHVKPTLTLVRGLETKQESRRKRTSRPRHASNLARAQRRWTLSWIQKDFPRPGRPTGQAKIANHRSQDRWNWRRRLRRQQPTGRRKRVP